MNTPETLARDYDFCQECESTRLTHKKRSDFTIIGTLLLLGVPILFSRKRWICLDCGRELGVEPDTTTTTSESALDGKPATAAALSLVAPGLGLLYLRRSWWPWAIANLMLVSGLGAAFVSYENSVTGVLFGASIVISVVGPFFLANRLDTGRRTVAPPFQKPEPTGAEE